MTDSNQPPPLPSPLPPPLGQPGRPRRRLNGWMVCSLVLFGILMVVLFFSVAALLEGFSSVSRPAHTGGLRFQEIVRKSADSPDKILLMRLEGIISGDRSGRGASAVELIKEQLERAAKDRKVRAVVLAVDSPGGEVLASDEIYQAIAGFQRESAKPVVAAMQGVAASGGYYVSAPCRWIVAHELTITGSIGVILHSYNWRGLMDKVGLRPEVYKSGRFKDMLSPDKREQDISVEERAMLQGLIDESYGRFRDVVGKGRTWAAEQNRADQDNTGRTLGLSWTNSADGRVLSGKQAFEIGLVDELGDLDAAVARARKLVDLESANVIEYQPLVDLSSLLRLFSRTESRQIKLDLGMDPPRLKAGQLYYLAPTFLR